MEPDRGDAGEPNGGKGIPRGKPYRHPVMRFVQYAARARADVALFGEGSIAGLYRMLRECADGLRSALSNIDAYQFWDLGVLCVPAPPTRFRAWSSFSRDRDVALTRLPFV